VLQGWDLFQFYGYRFVRFVFAGTALIDVAALVGFQPYLLWVRIALICYWNFLIAIVTLLLNNKTGLDKLIIAIFALVHFYIIQFGDKDFDAQQKEVEALAAGRADAQALQALQWGQWPAHAGLGAGLQAFSCKYLAALERDQQLLNQRRAKRAGARRSSWWGGNQVGAGD